MLKNKKGMTLPELIIAMAIGTIVIYGGFQAYGTYAEYNRHTNRVKSQKILMKNLFKLGKRGTRLIRIPAFNIDRSYSLNGDGELSLVNWDPLAMGNATSSQELTYNFMLEDGSAQFYEDTALQNDSFTIELTGQEGRVRMTHAEDADTEVAFNSAYGVFISRCVPKDDAKKHYTIDEALALERAPFGYFDENNHFHVSCCPIGMDGTSGFCTDGDIVPTDSAWRARVFQVNMKTGLSMFPKPGDLRYFTSAGFTFYFNDPDDPRTYKMYLFSLVNSCQSKVDMGLGRPGCEPRTVLNREVLSGNLSRDWGASGVISIDE